MIINTALNVKILNLYIIFYVLTCIKLLSIIYPSPAMHSLLVTPDIRNIAGQPITEYLFGMITQLNLNF